MISQKLKINKINKNFSSSIKNKTTSKNYIKIKKLSLDKIRSPTERSQNVQIYLNPIQNTNSDSSEAKKIRKETINLIKKHYNLAEAYRRNRILELIKSKTELNNKIKNGLMDKMTKNINTINEINYLKYQMANEKSNYILTMPNNTEEDIDNNQYTTDYRGQMINKLKLKLDKDNFPDDSLTESESEKIFIMKHKYKPKSKDVFIGKYHQTKKKMCEKIAINGSDNDKKVICKGKSNILIIDLIKRIKKKNENKNVNKIKGINQIISSKDKITKKDKRCLRLNQNNNFNDQGIVSKTIYKKNENDESNEINNDEKNKTLKKPNIIIKKTINRVLQIKNKSKKSNENYNYIINKTITKNNKFKKFYFAKIEPNQTGQIINIFNNSNISKKNHPPEKTARNGGKIEIRQIFPNVYHKINKSKKIINKNNNDNFYLTSISIFGEKSTHHKKYKRNLKDGLSAKMSKISTSKINII